MANRRRASQAYASTVCLRFTNEFTAAFGAADIELSLAAGNTHPLLAAGTAKIAVLPIPQAGKEIHKAAVFLPTLIDISGETAENIKAQRQQHQHVQDRGNDTCVEGIFPQEQAQNHIDDAQNHCPHQKGHIEFVRAVAALHKAPKTAADFSEHNNHP